MILKYARAYADLGWKVFPCHSFIDSCCTCGQSECKHPGKHPATRNGCKDASGEGLAIDLWWGRSPRANIGIATGSASDLCVLDIDTKTGPEGALATAWQLHKAGLLRPTWSAQSGSGGLHFYYRLEGQVVRNRNRARPMVDIKGENGVIIGPPSVNGKGPYVWRKRPGGTPALVPDWMVERSQPQPTFHVKHHGERKRNNPEDLSVVSELRNERVFKIGCGLAGAGETSDYIESFLGEFNRIRCQPPLPDFEIRKTIKSVLRYPR